jgi:hypothetical protein
MIRRMFVGRSPSRGRDADKPAWFQNNSGPIDRQARHSSARHSSFRERIASICWIRCCASGRQYSREYCDKPRICRGRRTPEVRPHFRADKLASNAALFTNHLDGLSVYRTFEIDSPSCLANERDSEGIPIRCATISRPIGC